MSKERVRGASRRFMAAIRELGSPADADPLVKDVLWIIEQNKRYYEALEFYANENNYVEWNSLVLRGPEINRDKGYKARKALKGDKQ